MKVAEQEYPTSHLVALENGAIRVTVSQESVVQVDENGTTEASWIRAAATYALTLDGQQSPEASVVAAIGNLGDLVLIAREQHRGKCEFILPPSEDEIPPPELLEVKEDW